MLIDFINITPYKLGNQTLIAVSEVYVIAY